MLASEPLDEARGGVDAKFGIDCVPLLTEAEWAKPAYVREKQLIASKLDVLFFSHFQGRTWLFCTAGFAVSLTGHDHKVG